MSELHYKLEMRRPKSPLQFVKQWHEDCVTETEQEIVARLQWWAEYDEYYSLSGWEYQITRVKPRKKRGAS